MNSSLGTHHLSARSSNFYDVNPAMLHHYPSPRLSHITMIYADWNSRPGWVIQWNLKNKKTYWKYLEIKSLPVLLELSTRVAKGLLAKVLVALFNSGSCTSWYKRCNAACPPGMPSKIKIDKTYRKPKCEKITFRKAMPPLSTMQNCKKYVC